MSLYNIQVYVLVILCLVNIAFNEKCEVLDQLQASMIAEVVEYICGNYGNSPYLSKYDKTIQHALNSMAVNGRMALKRIYDIT